MTDPSEPAPTRPPRRETRAARLLLLATIAYAVVVQSSFFARATDFQGDLAYHRGVALTMTAGSWQGEGPIAGVLSYFGGTFPLALGWTAELLGTSFDATVSVVSWVTPAVLPLVLLGLGRALWPGRPLDAAVLALVGTVGSSLARDRTAEWVFSALPAGANQWPLYPRDVAVVLLFASLSLVVRPPGWGRLLAAGLVCGIGVATQAQVGAYATAATAALATITTTGRGRLPRALLAGLVVGVVAIVSSAWWWVPRVLATREAGALRLRSHPLLPEVDDSAAGILNAFGLVGILGLVGLVVLLRRGSRADRAIAAWLLVLLPLVPLAGALTDLGVVTGRRTWLFAGIPLVVCAAAGATALLRRVPLVLGLPVLAVVLAIPSTAEVVHARDSVERSWQTDASGAYAGSAWSGVLASLRHETVAAGGLQVIASDNDAAYLWLHTGAQPFSLQLAGWNKLGYDVTRLTGLGYLDRVARLEKAFSAGVPGLCDLASDQDIDRLVLRRRGGMLAVHDLRPSARWRVDPEQRTAESIDREVADGLTYRDLNSTEALDLAAGASIDVGWSSASTRMVEVDLLSRDDRDALELLLHDGSTVQPSVEGRTYRFAVDGVPAGTRLRATARATVARVAGYERVDRPDVPDGTGPLELSAADLCG